MKDAWAVPIFSASLLLAGLPVGFGQLPGLPVSARVQPDRAILDALFLDEEGEPVRDLKPAELEIRQDGKKVRLDSLDFVGTAAPEPESTAGGVLPASNPLDFSRPWKPSVVVVLDLNSLDEQLPHITREIATLSSAHPETRFRVLVLGQALQLVHDFDSDPAQLPAHLAAIQPMATTDGQPLGTFLGKLERLFDRSSFEGNFDNLIDSARSAVAEAAGLTAETETRAARLATSLAFIASSLRSEPGRKHVWLFSAGYPRNAAPTLRNMIQQRFEAGIVGRQMSNEERARLSVVLSNLEQRSDDELLFPAIDQANRSQVSFYCIDTRGLPQSRSQSVQNTGAGTRGQETLYSSVDKTLSAEFLNQLSTQTAGLVIADSGSLKSHSPSLLGHLQNFSLLSFSPASKPRGGRFSRIELKVRRPGVRAIFRHGYVPLTAAEIDRERVNAAFNLPNLFDQAGIDVQANPDQAGSTLIQVMIPTGILHFSHQDQTFSNRVEVFGILKDAEGKRIGESLLFGKRHQLSFSARELADFRGRSHLVSAASVTLPKGRYQLVVVVRQGPAEEISSNVLELVI